MIILLRIDNNIRTAHTHLMIITLQIGNNIRTLLSKYQETTHHTHAHIHPLVIITLQIGNNIHTLLSKYQEQHTPHIHPW